MGNPTGTEVSADRVDIAFAEPRLGELKAAIEAGKRLLILTHDNPDPDALASAFALLELSHGMSDMPARIGFGGIVGRAENRTMVQELQLPVTPARDLHFDDEDLIALVDTQPGAGNNSLPAGWKATVVFDHHPLRRETAQAVFTDIRPDCGSTCAILTEYLQAAGIALDGVVATALFYGIQSETQDLGREATPSDIKASLALYPGADQYLLSRIRFPDLGRAYFRSLHRSLDRARTRGPVAISNLGALDYPDLVAELADFYLRLDSVKWSFCIGRFQDELHISVRTSHRDARAGDLLRRVIAGDGDAGGHGMIAGARVPVGDLSEEDARLLSAELVNRFLKDLGVEDETGAGLLDPLS